MEINPFWRIVTIPALRAPKTAAKIFFILPSIASVFLVASIPRDVGGLERRDQLFRLVPELIASRLIVDQALVEDA